MSQKRSEDTKGHGLEDDTARGYEPKDVEPEGILAKGNRAEVVRAPKSGKRQSVGGPSVLLDYSKVYDITVTLGEEETTYPGDTPYRRVQAPTDGTYELSVLAMSSHSGTHIDAPAHFFSDMPRIDDYPTSRFILPCRVVQAKGEQVMASDIPGRLDGARALLFKTSNSTSGLSRGGRFSEKFVSLSKGAADACVKLGLQLVGIDYISVDRADDDGFPVHRRLMEEGILILEGIDLRDVNPDIYTLICLPLKVRGGEASPVRAVLIR